MSQNPITVASFGQKPDTTLVPLQLDTSKNLKVAIQGSTPVSGVGYQAVAASQTAQALGTGAIGDVLTSITYIPATVAAGIVQIKDGANTAITLFVGGGTTALVDLRPITIPLNIVSAAGAWQVTTGANVSVLAAGKFTP